MRNAFTLRSTLWTVAAFIAVPALLFAFGWMLSYPLGIWPGVHPLDHPQPWPGRIALATTGILVPLIVAAIVGSRVNSRALLLVNWVVLALLAVGVLVGLINALLIIRFQLSSFIVAMAEGRYCSAGLTLTLRHGPPSVQRKV